MEASPQCIASPEPPRHSLAFILDQELGDGGLLSAALSASTQWSSPSSTHYEPAPIHHRAEGNVATGAYLPDQELVEVALPRSISCSSSRRPSLLCPCIELAQDQTHSEAYSDVAVAPLTYAGSSFSKRTKEERRKARGCTITGCPNYTIDRGLCFRHGGGKQCTVEGCNTSAKLQGLCWKHGGSTGCTIDGCTRGAKSRGLCWSHGGASKCTADGCEKRTISRGLCWAHGGGKRCLFDGCKRPATKKSRNFCAKHGAEVSQVDYVFEV